jgi:AraC-like DNA-binding protein
MINTIQIIILLQGIFLLFVLLKNKEKYKKVQFWLLISCIVSVIFCAIGDDDYHLFIKDPNWFLFESSLFITFLFLFIFYYNSEIDQFHKRHYLFFVPNAIYFFIELFELITSKEPFYINFLEFFIELTFLSYLSIAIYRIFKEKFNTWLLYFLIPINIILSIDFFYDIFDISYSSNSILSIQYINFYFLLIVAVLFYFMTYFLINSSTNLLIKENIIKYKNSNLSIEKTKQYKIEIINIMESERLFLDKNLTIDIVAKKLKIPKRHISEILNIHMKTNFQDFVNNYRVNAFIYCLENKQYENYSLLGIANEVGFNSKSSFNATFKKFKGLTPSQFQKSL